MNGFPEYTYLEPYVMEPWPDEDKEVEEEDYSLWEYEQILKSKEEIKWL